tara:strand:+ start:672 stop:884 length:213 start_codon:yes stop_codon:yes gene_type:complete
MTNFDFVQQRLSSSKDPKSLIEYEKNDVYIEENVLDESSTSIPGRLQYKTDDSYLETPIKEPNWLDNLCE